MAQRVGRGIALLFMTAALEGGEWSVARSGRTLPPGKTRHPFYRRLGGPQGRSGRPDNLVPTGIWSRTVQLVVIRYTDWATGPTLIHKYIYIYIYILFYYPFNQFNKTIRKGRRGLKQLMIYKTNLSHQFTWWKQGRTRAIRHDTNTTPAQLFLNTKRKWVVFTLCRLFLVP